MKNILAPAAFIVFWSLVELSSISHSLFIYQVMWVSVGFAVAIFISKVNLRVILGYKWVIWLFYLVCVLLLVLACFLGPTIRDIRGWIVVWHFNFQPVELMKIALILIYAEYFSRRHLSIARWGVILVSFIIFLIPALIVAAQPDLGSAIVLFGIWFGFLLASGLPWKRIAVAILIFSIIGMFGWKYFLRDYQRQRIIGVFYPEKNALTVNYSANQSKIAIGSGGLFGKGYKQGTQTQLGFLTEPATDFILAALVEEWGIIIGISVIFAFLILIFRILGIGVIAQYNFEKFISIGSAIVFVIHFLLNAGSVTGVSPVIGVSFPFLSYGGSNLLISFILLGIICSIYKRNSVI